VFNHRETLRFCALFTAGPLRPNKPDISYRLWVVWAFNKIAIITPVKSLIGLVGKHHPRSVFTGIIHQVTVLASDILVSRGKRNVQNIPRDSRSCKHHWFISSQASDWVQVPKRRVFIAQVCVSTISSPNYFLTNTIHHKSFHLLENLASYRELQARWRAESPCKSLPTGIDPATNQPNHT
jgi:hypothetical protein